jgi:cyclopropane-fatty-acyl-phospholipid synthase
MSTILNFPPSHSSRPRAVEGVFSIAGRQAIGTHYVPTLRTWRANFERHWPTLRQTRDDVFYRMWEFYLNSSAATFRAAKNDVWQFLLTPT